MKKIQIQRNCQFNAHHSSPTIVISDHFSRIRRKYHFEFAMISRRPRQRVHQQLIGKIDTPVSVIMKTIDTHHRIPDTHSCTIIKDSTHETIVSTVFDNEWTEHER